MSLSRSRRTESAPRVEINVVPLVDVSLVLLIIFMVTATFIKGAGMSIQLPSSSAAHVSQQAKRELVIGIDATGGFLWDGAPVSDSELAGLLGNDARESGIESRITIRGDSRAEHGRVVRAMTLAQEAGFSHLVIAVRPSIHAQRRTQEEASGDALR